MQKRKDASYFAMGDVHENYDGRRNARGEHGGRDDVRSQVGRTGTDRSNRESGTAGCRIGPASGVKKDYRAANPFHRIMSQNA